MTGVTFGHSPRALLRQGQFFLRAPTLKGGGFLLGEAFMKTVLLIDGGYLRASSPNNQRYNADFIEQCAIACYDSKFDYRLRTLYYDAPLFNGKVKLPVSKADKEFTTGDSLMESLARKDRFACRAGTLKFRGWVLKDTLPAGKVPEDADFKPTFEQKGVDMRVGLDISKFAYYRSVERILLLSNDTDMVVALKEARKADIEVGIIQLPAPVKPVHVDLVSHADFVRPISWPGASK